MKPTRVSGATRHFPGADGGTFVRDKLVTVRGKIHLHGMMSAWQPDEAELAALNAGAPVCLTVVAERHPPVYLGVGPVADPPGSVDD